MLEVDTLASNFRKYHKKKTHLRRYFNKKLCHHVIYDHAILQYTMYIHVHPCAANDLILEDHFVAVYHSGEGLLHENRDGKQ